MTDPDLCIYGDSPAALTAALQGTADGCRTVLVLPDQRVGGMLVEGLGSQDVNKHGTRNETVIGGLAREFYCRIGGAYGCEISHRFEPGVAEKVIEDWLREKGVTVYRNCPLREDAEAVEKTGNRVREFHCRNGRTFRARFFIDGTVEGDLMKAAGVRYAVGREGNGTYGETLNGVRTENRYRNFEVRVDPYRIPGNPASGLIDTIQDEPLGEEGAGDDGVMGFCFRQCLTREPENRLPIEQPEGYRPETYEIYRRYLAAGGDLFYPTENLPGGKTDLGSWHDLSGNLYGYSKGYPDGSREARQRIYDFHRNFIQGLYWFLTHDPGVPPAFREKWSPWGLAADEFQDNGGWPRRLYVRSGRRMISDYVITEADSSGARTAPDAVGIAWWPPDMHHVRRIVRDGAAYNEGFVFQEHYVPFPVSYRALIPRASECVNLLVPAALSSSHVGYGSVRLEWNQMVLGQSAAVAAAVCLREGTGLQQLAYPDLRPALEAAGVILSVS